MSVLSVSPVKSTLLAGVFVFGLAGTSHAAALPNAAELQTQLQSEWTRFTRMMGPNVTTTGTVSLTKDGMRYKAVLPTMSIKNTDSNHLKIENVTIQATPDASGVLNLAIAFPSTIPYYNSRDENIGTMTIGTQDIKATVQPADDGWQIKSLTANAKNVVWAETKRKVSLSLGALNLDGKPSQTQVRAQNIVSVNDTGTKNQIESMAVVQDAPSSYTMHLSDAFGLFATVIPNSGNKLMSLKPWAGGAAGADMTVKNFSSFKPDGKLFASVATARLQNKVAGIANNHLTLKTLGTFTGIKVNAAPGFSDLIPQTVNTASTIRNFPSSYFTLPLNTPEGQQQGRMALAAAGTQMQIDTLDITTPSGLKATGNGLVTATTVAPTYGTGNISLTLTNLAETMGKLQQQVVQGKGNTAPVMMALMMMQGMGKPSPSNPAQTLYEINLSPTGEVLVNGQNLTALAGMAGLKMQPGPGTAPAAAIPTPAAPAAPTATAPTAPGMTPVPWKKP